MLPHNKKEETVDRFPHLDKANSWPGLSTVDPFDLQVTFDPYIWGPDVELHLVKTRLDEGYRNVVGWKTKTERDSWYDSHSDRSVRLTSEFHILPGQEVKLPIAFEVLQEYNQIFIDFPPTRTADGSPEPHRFFYFVRDVEYRSPSATACIITLDEWTTHALDTSMPFIRLERGHAPMAAITPEHFLQSPSARCGLLAVPDQNFGGSGMGVIKHTAREVLNQGPMWCVLSFAADLVQNPGTYGQDGWRTPTTHGAVTQGAMGYETFAIDPADFASFMDTLASQAPQILSCIIACFLVPAKYLTVGGQSQYLGHTLTQVIPQQTIRTIVDLEPTMFGFPDEYKGIAKLYTAPYSWIEIVDDAGRTQSLRVEDTNGHLQLSVMASIAYPLIGLSAYVLGIGGGTDDTLQWKNFNDQAFRAAGDWTRTLREFSIPTYAILIDPLQDYDYRTFFSRQQAADSNAEAMRLGYAGAQATRDTVSANLARQQARLAQQQQEAQDAADLSDAMDLANQTIQESKLQADCEADEDMMTASAALAATEIAAAAGGSRAAAAASVQSAHIGLDMSQAAETHLDSTHLQQNIQTGIGIAGNAASGIAQIAAAVASGGATLVTSTESFDILGETFTARTTQQAGMGGAIKGGLANAGGLAGAVQGGVDMYFNVTENHGYESKQASGSTQLAQVQLDAASAAAHYADLQYTITTVNNQAQLDQSIATMWRKKATEVAHMIAVRLANLKNRHDSLNLIQGYETAISNADIATATANANRVKSLSDDGTATSKRLADASIERARKGAAIGTPRQITSIAGNLSDMTQPQIMSVRVRTQDIASIAAAGDTFLMWGYRFAGREWRISTLTPMPVFSYWMGEVQMAAGNINTRTREVISGIFSAGVTIWKDPDKIGSTSIYENRI